ncbi:hypothetical protein FGO68_gene8435 [Halteria grandinella]|uniref:Uncharacterized protein n=1 Tax=Halteria grandinella TaxID=5974 RepID=A0A8J8T0J4_HALGN|nr:hypothetical protein FGO68_gene8435 [Halteria grandinella]
MRGNNSIEINFQSDWLNILFELCNQQQIYFQRMGGSTWYNQNPVAHVVGVVASGTVAYISYRYIKRIFQLERLERQRQNQENQRFQEEHIQQEQKVREQNERQQRASQVLGILQGALAEAVGDALLNQAIENYLTGVPSIIRRIIELGRPQRAANGLLTDDYYFSLCQVVCREAKSLWDGKIMERREHLRRKRTDDYKKCLDDMLEKSQLTIFNELLLTALTHEFLGLTKQQADQLRGGLSAQAKEQLGQILSYNPREDPNLNLERTKEIYRKTDDQKVELFLKFKRDEARVNPKFQRMQLQDIYFVQFGVEEEEFIAAFRKHKLEEDEEVIQFKIGQIRKYALVEF